VTLFRRWLACGLALTACALASGCTPTPSVRSAWPIASLEATVSPPADTLRYPLTGLPAPDTRAFTRRPLCVKVADPSGGAVLTGVELADMVYETADSGSSSQLACVFQSAVPKRIGPVGMAGMPDLWIVPQYGAALFSLGAPAALSASIAQAGLLNLSKDTTAAATYVEGGNVVLVDGRAALAALKAAHSLEATSPAHVRFSASVDTTTAPNAGVTVPFSASTVVTWVYDRKTRVYLRSAGASKQRDTTTDRQISATNVVVMWARYTALDTDIAGGGGFDVTLGGSGQVSVFRGGERLDGKWKADGTAPPRFAREDGSAIKLAPGNTWVEVIPLSTDITLR